MDTVQRQRQRHRTAHDSITRLCGQGLPCDDLFTRLSGQLRKAVAFRTAGWQQLDPTTLLPMPGLLLQADHDRVSRIIHNEYFEPDVVKFRDLARAQVPAQSLWQATGGQPHRSTRYRTIYADLGNGDDVRMVFRTGSTVWGSACLARTAADPPFSRDDIAFLARVCEPVARGLRLSHLLTSGHPAGPAPPGVLILDGDDSIISLTEAARHWLAQLPPDHARGLDLPAVILSAASRARALAAGRQGAGIPEERVRTSAGNWLRLHAAGLTPDSPHGTGQIAVILEPAKPADLSPLILDLYGLTNRERQITQLLLRGLPTADIAQMLFISRHTLSDHMKAIFAKLGVTSRPELTALLLDQALTTPELPRSPDPLLKRTWQEERPLLPQDHYDPQSPQPG
jgi:DNA-binding CsgD family transcriptional regulator